MRRCQGSKGGRGASAGAGRRVAPAPPPAFTPSTQCVRRTLAGASQRRRSARATHCRGLCEACRRITGRQVSTHQTPASASGRRARSPRCTIDAGPHRVGGVDLAARPDRLDRDSTRPGCCIGHPPRALPGRTHQQGGRLREHLRRALRSSPQCRCSPLLLRRSTCFPISGKPRVRAHLGLREQQQRRQLAQGRPRRRNPLARRMERLAISRPSSSSAPPFRGCRATCPLPKSSMLWFRY